MQHPITSSRYAVAFLTSCILASNFGTAFGQIVSFAPSRNFSVASDSNGSSLVTGDFNGDGKQDLATPGTLLLGNGDGSFRSIAFVIPGHSPLGGMVVGDFNQDGKLDLVISRIGDFIVGNEFGALYVLLGNGDGTFRQPITVPMFFSSFLFMGDINGDGKPDLIAQNPIFFGLVGATSISLGKGNGSFQPEIRFVPPGQILCVADINGDGYLDLVVRDSSTGALNVLLGRGDGSFRSPVIVAVPLSPDLAITGDFNRDGKLDLVVGHGTSLDPCRDNWACPEGMISVLLGKGDGTFLSPVNITVDSGPYSMVSGDFNHDGKLDLAIGRQTFGLGSRETLILLGNGDGTFQPGGETIPGEVPTVAADLNGDGKVDLAANGSTSVSVLINTTGALSPFVSVSSASYESIVSPGSIVTGFGQGWGAFTDVCSLTCADLDGIAIQLLDSKGQSYGAALYAVYPQQISYIVPAIMPQGPALVTVISGISNGQPSNGHPTAGSTVQVALVAPGLFAANANGKGPAAGQFLRVSANGVRMVEPVAEFDQTQNKWLTKPLNLGPTDQIYLLLYGTGIRGRTSLSDVALTVGGVPVPVSYAGPQNQYLGLDQVNAGPLPRSLQGSNEVNVLLTVSGKQANIVTVNIR